ncbi:MAG: S8 family serine peptidase [Bacteroidales bacterium]|nr:S8 family serine peptidase [Bacteroidales bacterium]
MKVRRCVILLLFVLAAFLTQASGQRYRVITEGLGTEHTLSGHVIFKLTMEAAERTRPGHLLPEELAEVLEAFTGDKSFPVWRMFPGHKPPAVKYHPSGVPYADLSRIVELRLDDHLMQADLMHAMAATGLTEYVQPRYLPVHFLHHTREVYVPNDSLAALQYYLERVEAYRAWAVWKSDTNSVVGIVDTGVDLLHPDLVDAIKYNYDDPINGEDSDGDGYVDNFYGWDLGEGNNDPSFNKSAHGVHVSGIAAATADNDEGIAGVGFLSRFLPVKIDDEFGRLIKAYEGIVYAADQGVSVVNCSWGSHFHPGPFGQDIIDYAVLNRDVLVVAAAGNANTPVPFYPASLNRVLSVAATDSLDKKTGFSSFGRYVDVSAPGTGILSTWVNGSYIFSGGTSMAAPIVSGAATLIRSYLPGLSALQTKALIKMTADIIDTLPENAPYFEQLGYGRLNMYRALTETGHPYLTIADHLWDEEDLARVRQGHQFDLSMQFVNRLAPASEVYALLTTTSPHLAFIADSIWLGAFQTHELKDNLDSPFRVQALESLPENYNALMTVHFFSSDGSALGRTSFAITLHRDFLNLKTANLATTVSARGAIGFNYPAMNQGNGLRFNDSYTRIKCAGLIVATDAFSLADNIYGPEEGTFSETLMTVHPPEIVEGHPAATLVAAGSLRDGTGTLPPPLGVKIDYTLYFWDGDELEDFFIIRYQIINESQQALNNIYAGFFADWVLRDAKNHRAQIEVPERLAYAFSDTGGDYSGIQLLSPGGLRHYAFDNQGARGSMQINNGFSDFKKYTALTSNRLQAGFFSSDNDISSLLSSGPHLLLPADTLEIAFAIHAGESFDDVKNNTVNANLRYAQILNTETGIEPLTPEMPLSVKAYPNPFSERLTLTLPPGIQGTLRITLVDVYGRSWSELEWHGEGQTAASVSMPVRHLPTGTYVLRLLGESVRGHITVIKANH